MTVRYSEDHESQNARLADRYEQVGRYLAAAADGAQSQRVRDWALPTGVSPADYEQHMAPFRARVEAMIGYPPPGERMECLPALEDVGADEDGAFHRVRLPLLQEGLEAYGLLIQPRAPAPGKCLAVAIHGGGGTPELAAGILGPSNYEDMGRRLARRGHTVWMPACHERVTFDTAAPAVDVHRTLDLRARLVGTTLSAIDAFAIVASTEAVLASPHCEADGAIAVGLSYGGFRSLLVSALASVFRACVSSCYFNDRRQVLEAYVPSGGFSDWCFPDTLRVATDVELCRLICPRPLCIEVGVKDEAFRVEGAIGASAAVRDVYESLGVADRFEFDAFEGGHEFSGVGAFAFLDRMGL